MSQFINPETDLKPMDLDRTVHAITKDGWYVVRYDRASKWYIERGEERVRVLLASAVEHATSPGAVVITDRPGGKTFDARVREAVKERKG